MVEEKPEPRIFRSSPKMKVNLDCSSFVMCPLLVLPLKRAFLHQPLTVLTKQTRQAVLITLSFLDVYG